jgi:hypothetical protein
VEFDDEQLEIISLVNSLLEEHGGLGWGHYQGDVVPRVLAHYIGIHLPDSRKVVGPNVYIKDVPTEFDLMVVDSDSRPMRFTSAYRGEQVRCVIEVKRRGVIARKDRFEEFVGRIKTNFDTALATEQPDMERGKIDWQGRRPDCTAAYVALSETVNPKNKGSIRYADVTRDKLAPYPAFFLQDSRSREIVRGEWKRFVEYLASGG